MTTLVDWRPREYQKPLFRFLRGGGTRAMCVWHRRAGKDTAAAWHTREAAMQRPGLYWHMLPTLRQGRTVIWDKVGEDGVRLIDLLYPPQIRKGAPNESEMRIDCRNGSGFMVVGSDNYNALVGANPFGVVFSEWSLSDPAAWDYVRPILAENDGWAAFLFTPRGKNHAWKMYQSAKREDDWFTELLTVDDTGGVITPAAIERERRDGMTEAMIRQEFYCSFEAPLFGAYYADEMMRIDDEERICAVPHFPEAPVETWWDLGFSDQTAIWFVQYIGQEVHLIDYYETSGEGFAHYANVLREKKERAGFVYGEHIAPHDIEWGELGTGKTRAETAREHGIVFRVAPKISVQDGIDAVRNLLRRCWFDEVKCEHGIEALRGYRKARDEKMETWKDRPIHSWESHGCFLGETDVLTRNGTRQIMNLPVSGEVLTPCGWKQYQNPRITQRNVQLVEVQFGDGHTVFCTPEHMFLTENGWKSAASLRKGTLIQSSLTRSRNILMAVSIVYGQATHILPTAVLRFIEQCGVLLLALFQKAVTFTTKIEIPQITPLPIWNVSRAANIFLFHGTSPKVSDLKALAILPRSGRRNGTDQKRAGSGTAAMLNDPKAGRNGAVSRSHVSIAARHFRRWFVAMGLSRNTAIRTAKPLTIADVKPAGSADVWDITVPDGHCFSLANGAVVHNSDAFRYGAVAGKGVSVAHSGPLDYGKRRAV